MELSLLPNEADFGPRQSTEMVSGLHLAHSARKIPKCSPKVTGGSSQDVCAQSGRHKRASKRRPSDLLVEPAPSLDPMTNAIHHLELGAQIKRVFLFDGRSRAPKRKSFTQR